MPDTAPRILVPRPPERSGALMRALRTAGYVPDLVPLIKIEPAEDPDMIIDLLGALVGGRFGWVAVTSASTVKPLVDAAANLGLELPEALSRARVGAVGAATAAALRAAGVDVDLVATTRSAEGLLKDWPKPGDYPDRPARVLLPHGDLAEPTLAEGLRASGWSVRTVVAYRTTPVPPPPRVVDAWKSGEYAGVVLTSSSTARQLVATLGVPKHPMRVVCIGKTTATTARDLGLEVTVAPDPSPAGLVAALTAASEEHVVGGAS
jgi:uroporphyrinogen-III synthase